MLSDVVALIVGFASVRVSIATLFLLDSTVVLQYTVESLGFVEAQFLWYLLVALPQKFTSSVKTNFERVCFLTETEN